MRYFLSDIANRIVDTSLYVSLGLSPLLAIPTAPKPLVPAAKRSPMAPVCNVLGS